MRRLLQSLLVVLALASAAAPAVADDDHPEYAGRAILGWVEGFVLAPKGPAIRFKAKLDTGANTSSLHAEHIETFERGGEDWVRFEVPLTDHLDIDAEDLAVDRLTFERPVSRTVRIKTGDGDTAEKRYVVELDFCLGDRTHGAEFTLNDRSDYLYPVLLGRAFLEERIVVDPAYSFLARRDCPEREPEDLEPDDAVDAPAPPADPD